MAMAMVAPTSAGTCRWAMNGNRGRSPLAQLACYVAVVRGKSQRSSDCTRAASVPVNLSKIDAGNLGRDSAGKKRPDISTKTSVLGNVPRHQRNHRRVVRAAIPVERIAWLAVAVSNATALATITAALAYTRRPRNRTDGGVARRRHPSSLQHRLKRRRNVSAARAITPPRGLRG
jgi:hypothetical protein